MGQCVSALVRCLVGYEGWECGQIIFRARIVGARVVNGLHGFRARCLDPNTRAMHRSRGAGSHHKVGNLRGEATFPYLPRLLPIPPTYKLNGSSFGRPDVDLMFAKWAFNNVGLPLSRKPRDIGCLF